MLLHINAQKEHDPGLAEFLVERATIICGTREALGKRLGITTKALREIATHKSSMRYPVQVALEAIIAQAEQHGAVLVSHARMFATAAHGATGLCRMFASKPYIEHSHAVANLVARHFSTLEADAEHSAPEAIAAAWLNGVIEGSRLSLEDLKEDFPFPVAELVRFVTTPAPFKGESHHEHTRRTNRLLSVAPIAAQTIKVAEILDNAGTLTPHAGEKGLVYLMNKRSQLDVLHRAPESLLLACHQTLNDQEAIIRQTECTAST